MKDNKMDVENIDKKEKMEEEKDNEKGSSITATASHIQVAGNDSYQAVVAKHCTALETIKQYPNTCRYFEPTQSQLWLIVSSGYSANDAFEAAGDHNQLCCSFMANQQ